MHYSVPTVATARKALEVVCRSLNHRHRNYIAQIRRTSRSVHSVAAETDPTHLNENWANTVQKL